MSNKNQGNKQKQMIEKIQLLKQKYLKKNAGQQLQQNQKQSIDHNQIKHDNKIIQDNNEQAQNLLYKEQESKTRQQKYLQLNQSCRRSNERNNNESIVKSILKQNQPKISLQLSLTQKKPSKQSQIYQLEFLKDTTNDPFKLWGTYKNFQKQKNTKKSLDQEFSQPSILSDSNKQIKRKKDDKRKQLRIACQKWIQNPRQALVYLLFSQEYFLSGIVPTKFGIFNSSQKTNKTIVQLVLASTNPNFPKLMKQMIAQFIFNQQKPLNQSQKIIAYNIALEYFTPSAYMLSDILLVTLLKLGKNYIQIYVDQIIDKIQVYFEKLMIYETYILKIEYDEFIDCLLSNLMQKINLQLKVEEDKQLEKNMIWMLINRPQNNFLHQYFLPRNMCNEKLFIIFCILHPENSTSSLSLLYLKCLNCLTPIFLEYNIIENVIQYLNTVKVPDTLYKPTKSLKLKLIKQADAKKCSGHKPKQFDQQKGFLSYLNQRIVKLKEKVDQGYKEQKISPKIQVVFDPKSGAYITIKN